MAKSIDEVKDQMVFAVELPFMQYMGSTQLKDRMGDPASRLQFIRSSYLIPQIQDGIQLTVMSRLDIPHGHVVKNSYVELCKSGNVDVVEMSPRSHLEDDDSILVQFTKLDNKNEKEFYPLLRDIATHLLSRAIQSGSSKGESTTTVKRQRLYEDVGFSTNVAASRDQTKLGISEPVLLTGTREPFFLNLFTKFSKLLKNHCDWLWKEKERRRHHDFAAEIVKGNVIEAMRIAMNLILIQDWEVTKDYFCNFHTDDHNDEIHQQVATLSGIVCIVPGVMYARVCAIFYTRNSLSNHAARVMTDGEFITEVSHVLIGFDSWKKRTDDLVAYLYLKKNCRKHVSSAGHFWSFESHLNPFVALSPWIYYGYCLIKFMMLDYVEATSMCRAFATQNYTTYFFVLVVKQILDGKKHVRRGYLLGFDLIQEMSKLEREHSNTIPGLLCQSENTEPKTLPNVDEWIDEVKRMVLLQLQSWLGKGGSNSNYRYQQYKTLLKEMIGKRRWEGCGKTGINSALGAFAIIGTIPLHFADEYHNAHQDKAFKHFAKHFNCKTDTEVSNRLLISLSCHMLKRKYPGSKRMSQHGIWKAYSKVTACEDVNKDLSFDGQHIYEAYDHHLFVYEPPSGSRRGVGKKSLSTGLIQNWSFNNKWLPTSEIAQMITTKNTVFENWKVPKELRMYSNN